MGMLTANAIVLGCPFDLDGDAVDDGVDEEAERV
jgi:hypothetical protein